MIRRLALLGALLLASPLAAQAPGSDPPLVFPGLSQLEPAVAEQIAAAQQRLAEKMPPAAESFGELGKLYQAYSLREPAEAAYRNAARLEAEDFRWHHYLGSLLKDAGRLDEAAEAYGRAVALQPADTPARIYLAEVYRLQGRTEDAEASLRQALAADPASTVATAARALLGQTALDRKDFAAAAPLLESALEEAPEANRLHYLLATAYKGLGEPAKAQEHLAKSGQVGVAPTDPLLAEIQELRTGERLFLMRGKTAFDRGRFAEAAEEYRRVLSQKPDHIEARINLAASLAQLGDRTEAISQLREAVRQAPGNAVAFFNLGSLLAAEGSLPEAAESLKAAVELRPGDAEARRLLARVQRESGRLDEALKQYAEAVKADPADEIARVGEAETLVRLERYGEARTRLEDGLKALPSSALLGRGLVRLLAACPILPMRDGNRALEVAQTLRKSEQTADHAELVALALAELGRCGEAAGWQKTALAETAGADPRAASRAAVLARYQKGEPCRPGA